MLESERLIFRSPEIRLDIPFREIQRLRAEGGALHLTHGGETISLLLGPLTAKWEEKIRNPRSLLDKLGVKEGLRVSLVGAFDAAFVTELQAKGARVTTGRAAKESDLILFAASRTADLQRLETLKASLRPAGALWVIRPKGVPEITESDVMAGGKAAGLVDVKVASFSPTHTAEKFVIPVANR